MKERFFEVPKIGTGDDGDSFRPKYSDDDRIDGCSVKVELPEERYVALFRGDEEALEEIAEMEDATPLSEAEVGRKQTAGKSPTEDGPRPPEMGEGDTIEERVEDFIQNTTGSSFVVMEGEGEFSMPINFRQHPGFYQGQVGLLELEEMRKFPRYLIDTILRPETAVILPEHYGYWLWTAQFVDYVLSEGEEFERLISQQNGPPDFGFSGIVHDFLNTVNMIAFPRRLAGIDQRVTKFVYEMSGLTSRIDEAAVCRLFGPNSLAILDGLVKRRCNLNDDGNVEGSSIEMEWRPDSPERSGLNYHDRLQYWRHCQATEDVSGILGEIDELHRYDIEYLRRMGGVLGNTDKLDEELGSTNHFLRIVGTSQRNYNIHGNGSAPSIAPVVLSLCCLVFWDLVDESSYQEYQNEILEQIRKQNT